MFYTYITPVRPYLACVHVCVIRWWKTLLVFDPCCLTYHLNHTEGLGLDFTHLEAFDEILNTAWEGQERPGYRAVTLEPHSVSYSLFHSLSFSGRDRYHEQQPTWVVLWHRKRVVWVIAQRREVTDINIV